MRLVGDGGRRRRRGGDGWFLFVMLPVVLATAAVLVRPAAAAGGGDDAAAAAAPGGVAAAVAAAVAASSSSPFGLYQAVQHAPIGDEWFRLPFASAQSVTGAGTGGGGFEPAPATAATHSGNGDPPLATTSGGGAGDTPTAGFQPTGTAAAAGAGGGGGTGTGTGTGAGGDPCASAPCQNGGVCQSGSITPGEAAPWIFQCLCADGFTGLQCQTDRNECASSPCQNGGVCTDMPGSIGGGFQCQCTGSFSGPTCATPTPALDPCGLSPCANGGTCRRTATTTGPADGTGTTTASAGFECTCTSGWRGVHCTTAAPAPVADCGVRGCGAHGTCVPAPHPAGSSAPETAPSGSGLPPGMCRCDVGYLLADCSVAAPLLLCPDSALCLFWTYDAAAVHVQVVADTPGWFALLVNPPPTDPLTGDLWLFGVDDTTGAVMAVDAWSSGAAGLPVVDTLAVGGTAALRNVTGYQVAGQTVVGFSRALCAGVDDPMDATIVPEPMTMTYVLGHNDTVTPLAHARAAAIWSMWWLGALHGVGAPASPPRAVTVAHLTPTSLTAVWSGPACLSTVPAAATAFDVQSVVVGTGQTSPVFATTAPAVQLVALHPNTTYGVRVRSVNAFGPSEWTALVTATTTADGGGASSGADGGGGGDGGGGSPPAAPPAPQLLAATDTALSVAMRAPADLSPTLFNSFVLQMLPPGSSSGDDDDAAWRVVCAGSVTSCTVRGLQPGARYAFRVRVLAVTGTSPFSHPPVTFVTTGTGGGSGGGGGAGVGEVRGPVCTDPTTMGGDCSVRALALPPTGDDSASSSSSFVPLTTRAGDATAVAFRAVDGVLHVRVHTPATPHRWLAIGFGASADDGMAGLDALVLYPPPAGASQTPSHSFVVACKLRLSWSRAATPQLARDQLCGTGGSSGTGSGTARSWLADADGDGTAETRVYVLQRPLFAAAPATSSAAAAAAAKDGAGAAAAAAGVEEHAHTIEPGMTRVSWALGPASSGGGGGGGLAFVRHPPGSRGRLAVDFFRGTVVADPPLPRHWRLFALSFGVALLAGLALAWVVTRVAAVRRSRVGRWLVWRRAGPAALLDAKWSGGASRTRALWWAARLRMGELAVAVPLYLAAVAVYVALAVDEYERVGGGLDPLGMLGQLTALHLAAALLLPVRNSLWSWLVHSSWERLLPWHARVAAVAWALALAHGLHKWASHTGGFGRGGTAWPWAFVAERHPTPHGDGTLYGALAFAALTVAGPLAAPLRHLWPAALGGGRYGAFPWVHGAGTLAGVALAMLHSRVFRWLAVAPLALLGVDLALRWVRAYAVPPPTVVAVDRLGTLRSSAVTRLTLQPWTPAAAAVGGGRLAAVRAWLWRTVCGVPLASAAAQYVFVNVPRVSRVAWHPISISSAPTVACPGAPFTLHIRANPSPSHWSHRLWLAAAPNAPSSSATTPAGARGASAPPPAAAAAAAVAALGPVRIDGPYGRLPVHPTDLERYPLLILVAGGIGVTPLVGLLQDVVHRHAQGDSFERLRAVHVVWVASSADPFVHWGFADPLARCESGANRAYVHVHRFSTERYVAGGPTPGTPAAHGGGGGGDEKVPAAAVVARPAPLQLDGTGGGTRHGGAVRLKSPTPPLLAAALGGRAGGATVGLHTRQASPKTGAEEGGSAAAAAAPAAAPVVGVSPKTAARAAKRAAARAARDAAKAARQHRRQLEQATSDEGASGGGADAGLSGATAVVSGTGRSGSSNTSGGGGGGVDRTSPRRGTLGFVSPPGTSRSGSGGGGGGGGSRSGNGFGSGSDNGAGAAAAGATGGGGGLVELPLVAPHGGGGGGSGGDDAKVVVMPSGSGGSGASGGGVVVHTAANGRPSFPALFDQFVRTLNVAAATAHGAIAGGGGGDGGGEGNGGGGDAAARWALRASDVLVVSCGPASLLAAVDAACHRRHWAHHPEPFGL